MSPNLRDQTCFPSDMLQLLRWLLVVPLLAMAAGAHAEEKQCQLRRVMSLDMHTGRDGRVAIPVTIENHPASLLVDIGAAYSTLDASFAKSAGLSQKQISGTVIYMGGGIRLSKYVIADQFSVGPLPSDRFGFVLAPSGVLGHDSMGMLGSEVMSHFDIELDFAGSKFAVFSQDHCPGRVVYWTNDPYAAVPLETDSNKHIFVQVMLDGKPLKVMLDTGAARSFLDFRVAKDVFGIDEQNPNLKSLGTHGLNTVVAVPAYQYPFQTLTFEGVAIQHPDIEIVKYPDSDRLDSGLTLGISVLRQLHLYIAYREKMLYVTPAEAH